MASHFIHLSVAARSLENFLSCVDAEHPAKYPDVVYEDMQIEFLNKNYFNRQKHA